MLRQACRKAGFVGQSVLIMQDIVLPSGAARIIELLESNGYEAYAVGGCVRDSLLGLKPLDWDITTDASPSDIKRVFHRTIDTGIAHGTVTVRMYGDSYEVTTYRIDGDYSDGRHPDYVSYTTSLIEDLKRRDFTVNAMAYHPKRGLVDHFDGISDLKEGIIRCVGDPKERFGEDALRMLRAIRFSARLGFDVDQNTYDAIKCLYGTISLVSAERIRDELLKLITSDHPDRLLLVYESGLSSVFLPELDDLFHTPQNTPHHFTDVGNHTIQVLLHLPNDTTLRLAGLLHDIAKPVSKKTDHRGKDHFTGHPVAGENMAMDILKRLKLDNDTIRRVLGLVRFHDERLIPSPVSARRLFARFSGDPGELFTLKRADIMAQSDYMREDKLNALDLMSHYYDEIVKRGDCLDQSSLKVTGHDLIATGVPPGPAVGRILSQLLREVVDDPGFNTRERLIQRVGELMA